MRSSTTYSLAALAAAALAYTLLPGRSRVRPGNVVIITGGSGGLGLALAHRFAKAGCKLVLAARGHADLELAKQKLLASGDVRAESDILLVPADLTQQDQVQQLIDLTLATFGTIDVLINNAGVIQVGPIENQPVEAYRKTMEINFFAGLYAIYAALPHMLQQGTGAIVNICSIGGKMPVPHLAPYVAAKFAFTGFSETLHVELRSKGIRVTTVCPGLMRTGGESHAKFVGNQSQEQQWFDSGAKSHLVAVSPEYAANCIFRATDRARAEITISPQAWLGARAFGLAPSIAQATASIVNQHILPVPLPIDEPITDPSPS